MEAGRSRSSPSDSEQLRAALPDDGGVGCLLAGVSDPPSIVVGGAGGPADVGDAVDEVGEVGAPALGRDEEPAEDAAVDPPEVAGGIGGEAGGNVAGVEGDAGQTLVMESLVQARGELAPVITMVLIARLDLRIRTGHCSDGASARPLLPVALQVNDEGTRRGNPQPSRCASGWQSAVCPSGSASEGTG